MHLDRLYTVCNCPYYSHAIYFAHIGKLHKWFKRFNVEVWITSFIQFSTHSFFDTPNNRYSLCSIAWQVLNGIKDFAVIKNYTFLRPPTEQIIFQFFGAGQSEKHRVFIFPAVANVNGKKRRIWVDSLWIYSCLDFCACIAHTHFNFNM